MMVRIWRKGSAMSSRQTYAVRNDHMEAQFTRETEEAAVRQLHAFASASPDVPTDLYVYEPNCALWDWVATAVESEPLG